MTFLRIKFIFNKGRHGIPFGKLTDISKEVERFLDAFSKDMQLKDGEWIAEKFKNGSVETDVVCIGEFPDAVLLNSRKALTQLANPETSVNDLSYGLRNSTFLQFAKMAFPLEADDAIGIGIYNGSNRPKKYELSKQRALEIEKQVIQRTEQYGSVQGTITALFKGGQSTIHISENLTNKRIICFYPSHYYKKIIELLEERERIVNVEGWMTIINGEIDKLIIKTLEPLEIYREGDIEKMFGSDPDFTGNLSTDEFIDQMRS
jgi:hypothetical protein